MKKSTLIKAALVAAKTAVVVARTASRKILNSTEPNVDSVAAVIETTEGTKYAVKLGAINAETERMFIEQVARTYAKDMNKVDTADLIGSLASIAFDVYSVKDEKDTRKRNLKYMGLAGVAGTMIGTYLVMKNIPAGRMTKYFAYDALTLEQSRFLANAQFLSKRYTMYSYVTQGVNVLGVVAASIIVGL